MIPLRYTNAYSGPFEKSYASEIKWRLKCGYKTITRRLIETIPHQFKKFRLFVD